MLDVVPPHRVEHDEGEQTADQVSVNFINL